MVWSWTDLVIVAVPAAAALGGVLIGRKQTVDQSRRSRLDEYLRECRAMASFIVTTTRDVSFEVPKAWLLPKPPQAINMKQLVKQADAFASPAIKLSHSLDAFLMLVEEFGVREEAMNVQRELRELLKAVGGFVEAARGADSGRLESWLRVCDNRTQRLLAFSGRLAKTAQSELAPTIIREQHALQNRVYRRAWRWLVKQHNKNLRPVAEVEAEGNDKGYYFTYQSQARISPRGTRSLIQNSCDNLAIWA